MDKEIWLVLLIVVCIAWYKTPTDIKKKIGNAIISMIKATKAAIKYVRKKE